MEVDSFVLSVTSNNPAQYIANVMEPTRHQSVRL